MTCKESIKWLENLKSDLGKSQFSELWHYEQALDETIELLQSERLVELPCKVGDTVYDVVLCDDNIYRIFEMKITGMSIFGELYVSKIKPPFIWNLYLTDKYSYAYRIFSDIGKTVFLTKKEAEAKLKELSRNDS